MSPGRSVHDSTRLLASQASAVAGSEMDGKAKPTEHYEDYEDRQVSRSGLRVRSWCGTHSDEKESCASACKASWQPLMLSVEAMGAQGG